MYVKIYVYNVPAIQIYLSDTLLLLFRAFHRHIPVKADTAAPLRSFPTMASPPAIASDAREFPAQNVQPVKQAKQPPANVCTESSTRIRIRVQNEGKPSNNDALQRHVTSQVSAPYQAEKEIATMSAPRPVLSASKAPAQESVARNEMGSTRTNFFLDGPEVGIHAVPSHRNSMASYRMSYTPNPSATAFAMGRSTNRDVFPSSSAIRVSHPGQLMAQPLISTPAIPMPSLLYTDSLGDISRLFTPRPSGPFQARAFPTQSSDRTNQLSYSNGYVFDHAARSNFFNFAFSPGPLMMQASSTSSATDQASALASSRGPTRSPLQAVAPKKSIEAIANANKREARRKANKSRAAKSVKHPARKSVNVYSALSLDYTTRPCSCPKSRCVKLYCECFQGGLLCDPALCVCTRCQNTEAQAGPNGARAIAAKSILARRPGAFILRPKKTGEGCSCRKSR